MEDALSFSEKGKEKNNTFPFPLLILILQILIWLFPLVVFDQIIIVGFYQQQINMKHYFHRQQLLLALTLFDRFL